MTTSLVQSYVYDAYGNLLSPQAPAPYGFSTKEYLSKSGLVYFGARYYEPRVGRFITQDPILGYTEFPQSLHPYMYCYDNPVNLIDPYGELTGIAKFIAKEKAKKIIKEKWGDRFTDKEKDMIAEKFAKETHDDETDELTSKDEKVRDKKLKEIAERLKKKVEKEGNPEEKELLKKIEKEIERETKKAPK